MSSYLNKSRIRKVYGYQRYEPKNTQVVIDENGTVQTIDISKIKIDRQFYLMPGKKEYATLPTSSFFSGEYLEDIFSVSSFATASSITFSTPFSSKPIVTIEFLTSSNNLYNISNFVKNITTAGFDIQYSSEFSGSFVYRAVYAANYPIIVERLPRLSSNYYTASAGTASLNNSDNSTITYNSLLGDPTELFLGLEDGGTNLSQVYPSLFGSLSTTTASINISSQTDSTLNFIVVK